MSVTIKETTVPRTSVLVQTFDLPADLSWFNDLTVEERDEFFRGLMIVLSSPESERQRAVESHLRHWEVAMDVAARQGKPVLDAIRIYQPRPLKPPFEHFAETVRRLRAFERRHGMSSVEFYEKFQNALIPEGPWDYFEWRGTYRSFLHTTERFDFSEEKVA